MPVSPATRRAARRYRAATYARTPVPARAARHMASRFGYGITPALARDIRRAGGPHRWFEQQLRPGQIPDPFAAGLRDWFPALNMSAQKLWDRNIAQTQSLYDVTSDLARWSLLRRVYSRRQVHEVMTEFWSHLLHIPTLGEPSSVYRASYDRMLRRHALGRFDRMLNAAITHPAMLIFLDQAVSTAKAPNENLGRELLELHTVGRASGYTEDDVLSSARILTGWRVEMWSSWRPYYDPDSHWTGPVRVLGFRDANDDSDGRALTRRYLDYLAHHPATARRIAHRLAVRFVSDDPPKALVARLARVYLRHDTAIAPVLRELVRSAAFRRSVGQKVRTPAEDVVATWRVLGVKASRPRRDDAAAKAVVWQAQSMSNRPFGWPRPDGEPDSAAAWTSASRMLGSFQIHSGMGGGWWPTGGLAYRSRRSWVPELPIRFDRLVDHLSRLLLGRRSTSRLLQAVCEASGIGPRERITRDHQLISWKMPMVLSTILDTPAHLTR